MSGKHYTVSTTIEPGKVTLIVFTIAETQFHSFGAEAAIDLAAAIRNAAREVTSTPPKTEEPTPT